MTSLITIKHAGIRFEPPTLVIFYEENGKLRRRTMPIRHFSATSGIAAVVTELRERHATFLDLLPNLQLERLLVLLQENLKGSPFDDALAKVKRIYSIDPDEDLNKVDEEILGKKKCIMNRTFEENRIKPSDPDFQYDVEVDFEQGTGIESSGWDSDQDDPLF